MPFSVSDNPGFEVSVTSGWTLQVTMIAVAAPGTSAPDASSSGGGTAATTKALAQQLISTRRVSPHRFVELFW